MFLVQQYFSYIGNLNTAHKASVHEGIKPYKCERCDLCFTEKSKLKRHVDCVHDGNKRFVCYKTHQENHIVTE